jgi:hypothetical protein
MQLEVLPWTRMTKAQDMGLSSTQLMSMSMTTLRVRSMFVEERKELQVWGV